ncbi:MAG: hypothetical protein CL878_06785, partial [Dehalococcoidia bacterium]|nr:hypothetical protein [Dehalococcoidia bacterium]
GGSSVYLSNFYWYPPSRVQARLGAIAAARPGDVEPLLLGHTAQGRAITGVRLPATAPDRPRVVLTGTSQPSEGGQLACLWLLDYLLSEVSEVRALRKAFTFDVVPVTNPDGAALGTCMANSQGENPFFDAAAAARGKPSSAESAALWRLVATGSDGKDPPAAGYLEFHAYYQSDKPCGLYIVTPEAFSDPARRATYLRTSAALTELSNRPGWSWWAPKQQRQRYERNMRLLRDPSQGGGVQADSAFLLYPAAAQFGTASHLYKLHTMLTAREWRERAITVLIHYLNALGAE